MELQELDLNHVTDTQEPEMEAWLNSEDYSGQDDYFINPQLSQPVQQIY